MSSTLCTPRLEFSGRVRKSEKGGKKLPTDIQTFHLRRQKLATACLEQQLTISVSKASLVALWPLPTRAGARKIIISIHHHQDIGVGRCFDLGGGVMRHFCSKFLYNNHIYSIRQLHSNKHHFEDL